jgi:hypothetical protein
LSSQLGAYCGEFTERMNPLVALGRKTPNCIDNEHNQFLH